VLDRRLAEPPHLAGDRPDEIRTRRGEAAGCPRAGCDTGVGSARDRLKPRGFNRATGPASVEPGVHRRQHQAAKARELKVPNALQVTTLKTGLEFERINKNRFRTKYLNDTHGSPVAGIHRTMKTIRVKSTHRQPRRPTSGIRRRKPKLDSLHDAASRHRSFQTQAHAALRERAAGLMEHPHDYCRAGIAGPGGPADSGDATVARQRAAAWRFTAVPGEPL
jgi:hypothetical protein